MAKIIQAIRFPRRPNPGTKCPLCEVPMTMRGHARGDSASMDHILPRNRGGKLSMYPVKKCGFTRNYRVMCRRCNGLLSGCGQCIGALACVRAVGIGGDEHRTMKKWRMFHLAESLLPPGKRSDPMSKKMTKVASKIGADEFQWPADTAAARVWNLATLARGNAPPGAPKTATGPPSGSALDTSVSKESSC